MYPGGKGNCYQQIINQMPPHAVYIEPFLGAGSVMRFKRPAERNIGIERNFGVLQATVSGIVKNNGGAVSSATTMPALIAANGEASEQFLFICADALKFLQPYPFTGDEFIYLDPPYLMQTRRSQRALYAYEFATEEQHHELLTLLLTLPCHIAISGYWSQLYDDLLTGWRSISFEVVTRGGTMATEYLWLNYPKPGALHDYAFLGDDYRQRERIKRKARRWVNRFQGLPNLERQAVLSELKAAGVIVNHGDGCRNGWKTISYDDTAVNGGQS